MSTVKTLEKKLNGVDVEKVNDTVNAVEKDPKLAKFRFRLSNKWINCGHNHSVVSGFYGAGQEIPHAKAFKLDADEPPALAGGDIGPNPVEYLLKALAGCLTSTLVYHAALRGIKIEELEAELEGDIDLRGFLGLSDDVKRGYEEIRVNYKIKTDEKNLERLKALSKLSPVFDVVSKGTRVSINIARK